MRPANLAFSALRVMLAVLLTATALYPELTASVLSHATPSVSPFANWFAASVMGLPPESGLVMAAGLSVVRKQHSDLNHDANTQKQRRDLIADTLTTALVFDIETDLTISGGSANGALVREQPLTLVDRIKVYDGSKDIVDIQPRQLAQLTVRESANGLSGTALADGSAQTISLRQQLFLPFAYNWLVNPIECALVPRDRNTFYVEVTWVGTTTAALKGALVDGTNDRTFTFSNTRVRINQEHDPVAFAKSVRPRFLPRIRQFETPAIATSTALEAQFKSGRRIPWYLLHSQDAGVTTEGIISVIGLRDDQRIHREDIPARSWHEDEQRRYAGVGDTANVDFAYFYDRLVQNGRLATCYAPNQGSNLRSVLSVTGSATRKIVTVFCELEQGWKPKPKAGDGPAFDANG